ncbi:MAG: DedA family protein [Bdellovibrionales bacterium]|nr:DedA family protein [Bdellovibrionales bacterium]
MATQLVDLLHLFMDMIQNMPAYLQVWAQNYGAGLYVILGLVIFAETGLVVAPFLPGDSLLFAIGALMAMNLPNLDIGTMMVVLSICAIAGDAFNFHVGQWMAPRLFKNYESKWLNRKHLDKTKAFYDKHGGKTIVFARFLPILRTYAPFVAGMSGMNYSSFLVYNVVGGLAWVISFLLLGYFFGNLPAVQSNFHYVIFGIIVVSVLPLVIEFVRSKWKPTAV